MDIATLRSHAPSASDAQLIQRSHERVRESFDRLASYFFELLERSSSAWAGVLRAADSERLANLAVCMGWVAHADNPTVLGSLIFRVGAGPAGTTASRLDLAHLASALLESLARVDPEWNDETRAAWLRMCVWATWCFRAGHEARLHGRVNARDALHLSSVRAQRANLSSGARTLVPPVRAA